MLNFRFWIEENSVNLPLFVLIQNLSGLVRSRKFKKLVFLHLSKRRRGQESNLQSELKSDVTSL
ncbi:hypothetical protein [Coleofasciculus sp. E1-EBD-02]|uniref:hypothetical protein n=1 Tax=Coleofasciculus sp. E1-EBD-02 TaxID=3068481 RepID=UPI0032F2F306